MKYSIQLLLAFLAMMMMGCGQDSEYDKASQSAKNMPGVLGSTSYKPDDWQKGQTTWWYDTDGMSPGVPGCLIGTDEQGVKNGRTISEVCIDGKILHEYNIEKNKLISHKNDIAHPDVFDCVAWCIGQGKSSGSCVEKPAPPCTAPSASCECR